ncbi:MAG TPA: alkaline phosphatase family protein [Candidatus Polarisedimenticolia bacterium]|nr:alkaline phosphatase family protein [Candidatus Polarisedimenticolia bacterium]
MPNLSRAGIAATPCGGADDSPVSPGPAREKTGKVALPVPLSLIICVILAALSLSCRQDSPSPPRPKLVVLIVVDQLRADLLDRYDTILKGGFRRLRDEGYRFSRATVDHAVTLTAPGLVTLATGTHPSRHGIVDAFFYEGPSGSRRLVAALADESEPIFEGRGEPGVSPRRILERTLPEWLAASDPAARVVVLGSGETSAAYLAGAFRGDVFWYSPAAGGYVTSAYYRKEAPQYLKSFQREKLPRLQEESNPWVEQVPDEGKAMAFPDMMSFEADGIHVVFPHRMESESAPEGAAGGAGLGGWLARTPDLDKATLQLAGGAVEALGMGKREGTDLLLLELSQVEAIGRRFGPFSLEQLDGLLKLDRELGSFLSLLERQAGGGGVLVALTSSHGVANVPEHERERGRAGRRLSVEQARAALDAMHRAAPGPGAARPSRDEQEALGRLDFIAEAMTPEILTGGETCDEFTSLYRNSYRADRVPAFPFSAMAEEGVGSEGIVVRLTRETLVGSDAAAGGSPYEYDRWVPLIFWGAGIPRGMSDQRVRTVDLAPTLGWLAGVPVPPGRDGRPLREVLSGIPAVR